MASFGNWKVSVQPPPSRVGWDERSETQQLIFHRYVRQGIYARDWGACAGMQCDNIVEHE